MALVFCAWCSPAVADSGCGCWGTDLYIGGTAGNWRKGAGGEGFLPVAQTGSSIGFFQGGGGWFHDLYGGNIGVGWRTLSCKQVAYGVNGFFDFSTRSGEKFYQIGGGLELLGNWWQIHLNCYQPLQVKRRRLPSVFNRARFRQAYPGVDCRVGGGFPLFCGEVWGFGEYFYFYHTLTHSPIHGPRGRAEYRYQGSNRWELIVGGEVEYDRIHRLTGAGTLELRYFLSPKKRRERCLSPICRLMGRRVMRDPMIRVDEESIDLPLTDVLIPGLLFGNAFNDGIGTQTDPALLPNALAILEPGEVLFLLNDTGTIPVTAPAVIPDESQLLGFSTGSRVVTLQNGMMIVVSDLTGAGQAVLDGTGLTNVVEVGNDNFVCGLTINNGDNGVAMSASSGNLLVEDVTFNDQGVSGIVNNGGGALTITTSEFNSLAAGVINQGMAGNLSVTNSVFNVGTGVVINDPIAATVSTVSNNQILSTLSPLSGITFDTLSGGTLNADNNFMTTGIDIIGNGSNPRVNITNSTMLLGVIRTSGGSDLRVLGNTLTQSHIFIFTPNEESQILEVQNNTITAGSTSVVPFIFPIHISAVNGAYVISNNSINGTSGSPILLVTVLGATTGAMDGLIDNNFFPATGTGSVALVNLTFEVGGQNATVTNNDSDIFGGGGYAFSSFGGLAFTDCVTLTGNNDPAAGADISLLQIPPSNFTTNPAPLALPAANNGLPVVNMGGVVGGPVCPLPVLPP